MEEAKVKYVTLESAAKRLGCSSPTVRRVARSRGFGIQTECNRIVAIALHELPLIKPHIHATAGNPVWIAAKGKKKSSRRRGGVI
jgi:hypothetical protein